MKAIVIRQFGGPEVLQYADAPEPEVGAGEVLVRVAAASINPIDVIERAGLTKDFNPIKLPYVPGWDLSGTVVRVGPGVSGVSPGDKALAWASHTYAELCAIKAELLAKVPDGLNLVEAAALPLVTTTGAELIAVAAGVKAGQRVLVSGAFGGVGRSAVFAAKERGAKVIAGVLKKQLAAASSLGADEIVALDDESAMKALPPVDVVANAVRGKTAEQLLGKVKAGGVFASVTGAPANAKDYPLVKLAPFVSRQDAGMLRHMAEAVAAGKLVIPIDRKLPLKDAAEGHALVGQGGAGKVLLVP
ncbi:MAG TPA: NADP-dependent oxidoreductase [Roseiarcus sp.]|nr:NADP-dependent oxidoreductase [Roseiarcus sp.]